MKTQKTSTANTHIHADGITHTHVDGITHAHADGSTHTHADDTVHTHASGSVHTHAHSSTHTHPHHHENTKAVLNRMNRAIGHMEAVRTMRLTPTATRGKMQAVAAHTRNSSPVVATASSGRTFRHQQYR